MRHFLQTGFIFVLFLIQSIVINNLYAQKNTGAITGQVLSNDGKPAPFVTVILHGTGKNAVTDDDGSFHLTNLKAGNYLLEVSLVGYRKYTQSVFVTTSQTTDITIKLDASTAQLKEVVVTNPLQKFAKKESDYIARMPLKNMENPQVYSVVNKELLKEQLAIDYIDAFRNAPGLVPSVDPTGNVTITMRGFPTYATIRNGLPAIGGSYIAIDPVNMERTEIIKGPSGTLFGSSAVSFGGLINRVTKKPYDAFGGELSYTTGNWNTNRLTADINTPLNNDKTALLRLNAAYHNQGTFQDYGFIRSYTFSPSFIYKASSRLTFQFDMELYGEGRTAMPRYILDSGKVSFRNFKNLPINYTTSPDGQNLDASNSAANFFAKADYKIDEHWTSSSNYGFNKSYVKYSYQGYHVFLNDSLLNRTYTRYGPRDINTVQFQQNFVGQHTWGAVKNKILAGFDLTSNNTNQQFANIDSYDTINVKHPFLPADKNKADGLLDPAIPYLTSSSTLGAYASDVFNYNKLSVMLSLRVDRFSNKNTIANGKSLKDEFHQTAWSPKLGLVYQIIKDQLSVFGNYMNGFVNLGPATQPDGTVLILKPQEANQWEAGFKADAFNHKLNATVSYYDISVSNATRTDVNLFTVQDGTQRSRGVETELITNPIEGLNIVLGYAYNKNTFTKADAGIQGKYATAAPKDVANYWISYKVPRAALKNLGIGFGGNYIGNSYFDAANVFTLPSYTLVNATLFYEQSNWRLAIKANNLTNQQYWSANGTPMPLRQWLANVTFRF